MKSYCKFRDEHKDDVEIIEELNCRLSDQRFAHYYGYYGSKGCGSRKYREKELVMI